MYLTGYVCSDSIIDANENTLHSPKTSTSISICQVKFPIVYTSSHQQHQQKPGTKQRFFFILYQLQTYETKNVMITQSKSGTYKHTQKEKKESEKQTHRMRIELTDSIKNTYWHWQVHCAVAKCWCAFFCLRLLLCKFFVIVIVVVGVVACLPGFCCAPKILYVTQSNRWWWWFLLTTLFLLLLLCFCCFCDL